MGKNTEENQKKDGSELVRAKKTAKYTLLAVLAVMTTFLLSVAGYSVAFSSKSYRNLYLGDINMGGKSKADLSLALKQRSEEFLDGKFELNFKPESGEAKKYEVLPADIGLVYDNDKTVSEVFGYGRNQDAWHNFGHQLLSLIKPARVNAVFSTNNEAISKKIADIAYELDVPEKDYNIIYAGGGKFSLETEKQTGKRINQQELIDNVKLQISNVKIEKINFSTRTYEPKVTEENAKAKQAAANQILAKGELKLTYNQSNFSLDIDTLGGLVKSRPKSDDLELYIDEASAKTQVAAVAANINQQPKNAVLSVVNGAVTAFSQAQIGRILDEQQAVIDIGSALLSRSAEGLTAVDTDTIALKVKETQPEISSDQIASYGLKELVATGTTDYRKSPVNRVHNITVGAAAINGTLLKPGEEFSTLGKLGAIDASTGYLPELVIKNNKTVPDYGGGLCQVSTTLFRTALNAGMKITSRQNHSYRVSYYEPPIGMDATIFSPSPDFKFINNYSSYILVQSHIEGTKITFDFYGTRDTRVVNIGASSGYDYVEPPAAVYTVDATLPPGTENLVSHAHQGASAKFHYEVIRDGVSLQSIDFLSKYVALPEMWSVSIDSIHNPQPPAPPVEPAATPPA